MAAEVSGLEEAEVTAILVDNPKVDEPILGDNPEDE